MRCSPKRRVLNRRAEELTVCVKPRTPNVPADAHAGRNRVALERAFLLNHPAEIDRSKRTAARIAPSLQPDRFEATAFVNREIDCVGVSKRRASMTRVAGRPLHPASDEGRWKPERFSFEPTYGGACDIRA